MERSRDKVIAVRTVAASGLCRLQNPIDPDEEVISRIAENIRHEQNSSVRVAYASEIMVHPITSPAIIETLRDEDITVRIARLKNLEEHATIQVLSMDLRLAIVHCLEDRNEVIVKAAEAVIIRNWASNNSLLVLLSLLEVEDNEITVMIFIFVNSRESSF